MKTGERLRALDRRVLGPYRPLTLVQVRDRLAVWIVGALGIWYVSGAGLALALLLGALTSLAVNLFASTRGRS